MDERQKFESAVENYKEYLLVSIEDFVHLHSTDKTVVEHILDIGECLEEDYLEFNDVALAMKSLMEFKEAIRITERIILEKVKREAE